VSALPEAAGETPRPRGRPRSVEADQAILLAAAEVFADVGFDALTLEAVASRAGVGKASIYRRYTCKVDLVAEVVAGLIETMEPAPDTGSTRADLFVVLQRLVHLLDTTPLGRALPVLIATRRRVPELDRALEAIVATKRAQNRAVVERGIARGDLRADADPDRVVETYLGPVFHRLLLTDQPIDTVFLCDVIDMTLRAYGCPPPRVSGGAAPRSGTRGRATAAR
jgi:AcrR family transcriptional regulator